MNVSPTSRACEPNYLLPSRPPTPPCTIGDLAVQLNQQSLRIDTSLACYSSDPLTPASENNDAASPTEQTPQERPTYSRVAASVLRMQRQSNSRMQCSASHVRDLSKLVKMIEEQAQCTISDSTSRSHSKPAASASTCADDEGVDMDYDIPSQCIEKLVGIPTWRSAYRRESCVRVTKPVRMRKRSKEGGVCKRRSS